MIYYMSMTEKNIRLIITFVINICVIKPIQRLSKWIKFTSRNVTQPKISNESIRVFRVGSIPVGDFYTSFIFNFDKSEFSKIFFFSDTSMDITLSLDWLYYFIITWVSTQKIISKNPFLVLILINIIIWITS